MLAATLRPTLVGLAAGTAVGATLAVPALKLALDQNERDDGAIGVFQGNLARAAAGVLSNFALPAIMMVVSARTNNAVLGTALLAASGAVPMAFWGVGALEELGKPEPR